MLASAWKIVLDILRKFEQDGLTDHNVKMLLKKNKALRSRYLALCDMADIIVNANQTKVSVLATSTREMLFMLIRSRILTLELNSTLRSILQARRQQRPRRCRGFLRLEWPARGVQIVS